MAMIGLNKCAATHLIFIAIILAGFCEIDCVTSVPDSVFDGAVHFSIKFHFFTTEELVLHSGVILDSLVLFDICCV